MDFVNSLKLEAKRPKILNVGVGTGHTSELLMEFGDVTSIEYDEDCCQFVRENTELQVIQGSILELPFDKNSFDLVCAFDVLEHVGDDKLATSELVRVCKKSCAVLVTVPAFNFLWSHHDVVNHHYRRYSKGMLVKVFDEYGIQFCSYYNFVLFPPILLIRALNRLVEFTSKRKKASQSGSDFSIGPGSGPLSKFLYRLFVLEKYFLKNRVRFPWGVSLLLLAVKNEE